MLDDLERVLMEIAERHRQAVAAELRRCATRIEARGMLFRLRVVDAEMREREAVTGRRCLEETAEASGRRQRATAAETDRRRDTGSRNES